MNTNGQISEANLKGNDMFDNPAPSRRGAILFFVLLGLFQCAVLAVSILAVLRRSGVELPW